MQARDPISFYLEHRVNLTEIGQSFWNWCVLFAELSHNCDFIDLGAEHVEKLVSF